MNKDYLWDRSGDPDPEIERLEKLMGSLRSDRPAPEFPAASTVRWKLAIAAAVAVAAVCGWLASRPSKPSWEVSITKGAGEERKEALRLGSWLETGADSRARIRVGEAGVGEIGAVEVDPNSRVRLAAAGATDSRLQLARGKLHAVIWAPPGRFAVDTPSASAIDLGCAYSLEVNGQGVGLVQVTSGWVGFQHDGRESFVPAGAECVTLPGKGPQTPYYADASARFRQALRECDGGDRQALDTVLAEARARDAFTLWHLLFAKQPAERERVFTRLAQLAPPPAAVTREGIVRGDREMLDRWWDQLGLEDTTWWRKWERRWPQ